MATPGLFTTGVGGLCSSCRGYSTVEREAGAESQMSPEQPVLAPHVTLQVTGPRRDTQVG